MGVREGDVGLTIDPNLGLYSVDPARVRLYPPLSRVRFRRYS